MPIETLLRHRDWVRRLARSMVSDPAAADDVEQQTWLRALRSPPRDPAAARSWLSAVVRSRALSAFRSSSRRAVHEERGARSGAARATADLVAESDSHQRLVHCVLALDEPYRTTILLRFLENLPPREVAARMGVPIETVRTRVRRALATLRERLGGDDGGEAWLGAAAVLIGAGREGAVGSGSLAPAATITGGLVMTGKTTLAAAVVLACVAGFVGGRVGAPASSVDQSVELSALQDRLAELESRPAAPGRERRGGGGSAGSDGDRLESVLVRQNAQDERVAALESELASTRQALAAVRAGGAAPAPAAELDVAKQLTRLADLSTAQVLSELQRLTQVAQRTPLLAPAGTQELVVRGADQLLQRTLEPDERVKGHLWKGRAQMLTKLTEDARATFQTASEVAGATANEWRNARHELAYTFVREDRMQAAVETFLAIADHPDVMDSDRAYYRQAAAGWLASAGDKVAAGSHYRRVLRELGDSEDEHVVRFVKMARAGLKQLERSR